MAGRRGGKAAGQRQRRLLFSKDEIANHPVMYISGCVVAGGIVVAAIMGFFWESHVDSIRQSHELATTQLELEFEKDKSDLEARVRGIERRLGGGSTLDVSKLFRTDYPISQQSDLKSEYFDDGNYFAIIDETRWSAKKIHEAELHEEIIGLPRSEIYSASVLEAMGKFSTRIWRGRAELNIQQTPFVKKIFPYILVSVIKYSDFREFFQTGDLKNISSDEDTNNPIVDPETLRKLNVYIHSDATGIFALRKLWTLTNFSREDQNLSVTIRSIEKKGPILYAQVYYTIDNVRIENHQGNKLYVVSEWILFARKDDFVAVEIVTPSAVPALSGDSFTNANLWIGSFVVAPPS